MQRQFGGFGTTSWCNHYSKVPKWLVVNDNILNPPWTIHSTGITVPHHWLSFIGWTSTIVQFQSIFIDFSPIQWKRIDGHKPQILYWQFGTLEQQGHMDVDVVTVPKFHNGWKSWQHVEQTVWGWLEIWFHMHMCIRLKLVSFHNDKFIHRWWELNDGNVNILGSINLGPVYTMDLEVGPWKIAFFHDLTW